MPIGYLIAVGVAAAGMLLALVPLRGSRPARTVTWLLSTVANESPFVAFYWVLAVTLLALLQGDLDTPVAWIALLVAGVTFVGT
ncbi:MAG TPA: hypothetical protein VIA10_10600, partial [Gaiellaceae bacterium]